MLIRSFSPIKKSVSDSGERLSDVLRTVNITVISDQICDQTYGGSPYRPVVFTSMLCAGDMTKGSLIFFEIYLV